MRFPAPALAVMSMLSVQLGSALSTHQFAALTPALASTGHDRGDRADRAVARAAEPGRRGLRPGRGAWLGRLHPADPARRRPAFRAAGTCLVPGHGGGRRGAGGRLARTARPYPGARRAGSRAGRARTAAALLAGTAR